MTGGVQQGSRERRATKFFTQAGERFEGRYDYTHFEYIDAKTRSTIVCPEHGNFSQTPDKHLTATFPCPECWAPIKAERVRALKRVGPPKVSKAEYLQSLSLADRYSIDLSEYIGLTQGFVTLICTDHGRSKHTPQSLLHCTYGCLACAAEGFQENTTKSFDDFRGVAGAVHNYRYEYPRPEEYVNRKSIVTIVCPIHGEFQKKAQKHLAGQGCFRCGLDGTIAAGGFPGGYSTKTLMNDSALAGKPATLYYLKVGQYFKVGVTTTSLQRRISSIRNKSKLDVAVIQQYSCELLEAFAREQTILMRYTTNRVYRKWSTELFSTDVLKSTTLEDVVLTTNN